MRASFFLLLLGGLFMGVFALDARAEAPPHTADGPTVQAEAQALKQAGQTQQALELLLAHEDQWSGQSDFDYALGSLALEVGQYGLAQVALERVVLVDPAHAGAWLDLAIAHFRLGEPDNALHIIRHVEENFDPPPAFKAQLAKIRQQLQYQRLLLHWNAAVSVAYGYVQNPNSGLTSSRFNLTSGNGDLIPIEIDPSMQAQSDHVSQLRGTLARIVRHDNGAESTMTGSLLLRSYNQQTDFNLLDSAVSWDTRWALGADSRWSLHLNPSLRYVSLGGESLGVFSQLSAGLSQKIDQCEWGGQWDLEWRRYQNPNFYNARIPWLGLALGCETAQARYGAGVRYGMDFASAARPGGDTQKLEANLHARFLLTPQLIVGAMLYAAEYRDQEGYSLFLDNNQPRHIHRFSQRAELLWQLPHSPHWSLQGELEHSRDRSNIPTAQLSDWQLLVGLRYQFNGP